MIFARRTAAAYLRFRDLRFPTRFLWKWDPSNLASAANRSLTGTIDDENRNFQKCYAPRYVTGDVFPGIASTLKPNFARKKNSIFIVYTPRG